MLYFLKFHMKIMIIWNGICTAGNFSLPTQHQLGNPPTDPIGTTRYDQFPGLFFIELHKTSVLCIIHLTFLTCCLKSTSPCIRFGRTKDKSSLRYQ